MINKEKNTENINYNKKINEFLADIINELPISNGLILNVSGDTYLSKTEDNIIVNYDAFIKMLGSVINTIEDVKKNNENLYINALKMIPGFIANCKIICINKKIFDKQKYLREKYFTTENSPANIKLKTKQLRSKLLNCDCENIDEMLNGYKIRVIDPYINDLKEWVLLLEERRKISQ